MDALAIDPQVTNKLAPLSGGRWSRQHSRPASRLPGPADSKRSEGRWIHQGRGRENKYGFGRDFDTYLDDVTSRNGSLDSCGHHLAAVEPGAPFFLFLGYDVHGQYDLPESKRSSIAYGSALNGSIEEQAEQEKELAAITEPGAPAHWGLARRAAYLKRVYGSRSGWTSASVLS